MVNKALTTTHGSPLQVIPASQAGALPAPEDILIVPGSGPRGEDCPMTYEAYMRTVRAALKSRIGRQMDRALAAHEAREQAAAAAGK